MHPRDLLHLVLFMFIMYNKCSFTEYNQCKEFIKKFQLNGEEDLGFFNQCLYVLAPRHKCYPRLIPVS